MKQDQLLSVPSAPCGRKSSPFQRPRLLRAWVLATVLAASAAPLAAQTITQTEEDDTFATANPTGLTAGSSGLKVAFGHSADGLHGTGEEGDFTGDFDFFKLSANTGQVIRVDLKNASANTDFDSVVGLYGPAGTLVASNDDRGGGNRSSFLTYTAAASGDYYVVVANWTASAADDAGSLPADPTLPGSGNGPPGGTGGPYEVVIGLDATAPVVEYDNLSGAAAPAPTPIFKRTVGQVGNIQTAPMLVRNTGNAPLTITGWAFTGADAARFSVQSSALPITLNEGQTTNITLVFSGDGIQPASHAKLDPASNDPLDVGLAVDTTLPLVKGGGKFTFRQVYAASGTVGSIATADSILAGTNAGASATVSTPIVNYSNIPKGMFTNDTVFPAAGNGDNFAAQATGNFYVSQAGTYSFRVLSDDGQRLRVDGITLIDNPTANVPAFGTADLSVGVHTVEYTMFEIGGDEQMELTIATQLGSYASDAAVRWELLEAYSPDSDGDGMPDQWETENGLNPNLATGTEGASGDPDGDLLTNIQEYGRGTLPKDPDSDDDGLSDLVETKTGVWVSPSDRGTNPLVADSDNDGLGDAIENPTQTTTGLSQPGSDPNKTDTDSDGFPDRVEVTLGSDPKQASSVPNLTYTPLLSDNFDGAQVNSTYAFTSNGPFTPLVTGTGVATNNNAIEITAAINSNNNSVAWNKVTDPNPTQALRLSFDFRMSSGGTVADGIGIGLFRTGTYGTTGPNNPAATKNWENPTAAGGFPNALSFGFGIFGTNFIRMCGPAQPAVALSQTVSPFTLSSNQFHRAIITMLSNGPSGTIVSMQIIQDVNGAATPRQIFSNILVPGFDLPNESFRLIAGGRTGGFNARQDIDNVSLATSAGAGFAPQISIAKVGGSIVVTYSGILQSSTNVTGVSFTDVPGATSPYTVPAGSPPKQFYRARN